MEPWAVRDVLWQLDAHLANPPQQPPFFPEEWSKRPETGPEENIAPYVGLLKCGGNYVYSKRPAQDRRNTESLSK